MGYGANRPRKFAKGGARFAGRASGFVSSPTPLAEIRAMYANALRVPDPPAPVRTLADMTPEEIVALERQYGAKVKR